MGMIHAFNFSCNRDKDLSELMTRTFLKHCPQECAIQSINTDGHPKYWGYGNGSGWPQGMMKIQHLREMSFADDDWVLSVDSDVVFCNSDVFKLLDPQYGIIGIQGQQPWDTFYGPWAHMSGCLIFLRGDVARKIASWPNETFDEIRINHFKPYNITENEDVMLSLFAWIFEAKPLDIGSISGITSNDFEQDIEITSLDSNPPIISINRQKLSSLYHLNYCPTHFMGEKTEGKWSIPGVLKKKGIEL